jgi:phosphoglycolate phosphatase-like HAD superfamily hydrolase
VDLMNMTRQGGSATEALGRLLGISEAEMAEPGWKESFKARRQELLQAQADLISVRPEAVELIRTLRDRGVDVAMVSDFSSDMMQVLLNQSLDEFTEDQVEAIVCGNEVSEGSTLYREAMQRLGVSEAQVVLGRPEAVKRTLAEPGIDQVFVCPVESTDRLAMTKEAVDSKGEGTVTVVGDMGQLVEAWGGGRAVTL